MTRVIFTAALLLLAGCINGSDSSSAPAGGPSASPNQDETAPTTKQATREVIIYVDGMT